jgi:CheY-like chemotaxis protein
MNTALDQFRMKKALIVEDHPDMLEVLTLQMEILGFAVIAAKNGKEGVEKAIEEKPDLILMDILMPGMDGREATRIIRSNAETHDIPILAATALFLVSDLGSCAEAGCNDYLVKPFTLEQLQRKILEYISPSNPTVH